MSDAINKLVITKGYGVRAGFCSNVTCDQVSFFSFCFEKKKKSPDRTVAPTGDALRKFHVTDSQNTPDQITRGRRFKRP